MRNFRFRGRNPKILKQSRGDFKTKFIMKKALFLLGAVATMGFVACNTTSDCDCTVGFEGVAGVTVEVLEFEGTCDEVAADALPAEWQDIEALGGSFSCVEK